MSERNYIVEIIEASKDLTAREAIKLKDTTDAIKLDDAIEWDGVITLDVDMYAELLVHNSKSEKGEYPLYIVIATDGKKYYTGSNPFWTSFKDIISELEKAGEELTGIKVYKRDSKNYTGKQFITCGIE